jgi:hypothetical protein
MAMGIVSEEDFIREQERLISIPPVVEIREQNIGRGKDVGNVPNEVRKIIGEVGQVDRQGALALASSLGIGKDSVGAYSNGATSAATYNEKHPSLGAHVDKVRNRIVKKAKNRLLNALDSITEEKLQSAELKDASSVAKDMSTIIKNMEPEKVDNKIGQQNNFVLYRPMMKSEEAFDVIYSKE